MQRKNFITPLAVLFTAGFATVATAQAPAQPPMFATTKVEGTDNVYVFRYQNRRCSLSRPPA
jgi:hypothetical protein